MEFKNRIIKKSDGSAEIRITVILSKDALDGADKIRDDETTLDTLRVDAKEHPMVRLDRFFCNLRILAYHCHLWEDRDVSEGCRAAIKAMILRRNYKAQYDAGRSPKKRRKRK